MSDFWARPEAGFLLVCLALFLLLMFGLSRLLKALIALAFRPKASKRAPDPSEPSDTVIVDGSNVMYWKDGKPRLDVVIEVLAKLYSAGLSPGVMFDANAGYLVSEAYMHDAAFARKLGVPKANVLVVPKGTPADATILKAARDMRGRVVSNDRFRDWAEEFPEVEEEGFLIKGGYAKGAVWLQDVA